MAKSLNCPSCGASTSPDGSSTIVTCEYCAASISVAEFFKESSGDSINSILDTGLSDQESIEISRLVEGSEFYLSSGEFKRAKVNLEKILEALPGHLPSRFNLAQCELFSGEGTSIERAKNASRLVENSAQAHEMVPELLKLKEAISYNITSIGLQSIDARETIECVKISLALCDQHQERDNLISDFYEKIYVSQFVQFERELKEKKKKYSPNQTILNIVSAGAPYCQNLCDFGATLIVHLDKNPKSINPKIADIVPQFREIIYSNCSDKIRKVDVGMFGISYSEVSKESFKPI
jgi:hypothetical protein